MREQLKKGALLLGLFLVLYFLPVGLPRFDGAVLEALQLARWYAREHVVFCLVPAFFIAGAIGVFLNSNAVMRLLGPSANKYVAYGVASVSGTILAVCSCTVLPLFAGIYKRGAGLGPAIAFLYAGPAINVLAIILTARVLGFELGVARAVGAVVFSIVIGAVMQLLFHGESQDRVEPITVDSTDDHTLVGRNAWFIASLAAILIAATWSKPDETSGFFFAIFQVKWWLAGLAAISSALMLVRWMGVPAYRMGAAAVATLAAALIFPHYPMLVFGVGVVSLSIAAIRTGGSAGEWFDASWGYAVQILPLLFAGVFVSGLLLGRPGHEGIIPSSWIGAAVGGNSLWANFVASFVGAFMYFATMTEIPILQGLIGSGMGKGPALALLLAGPALSLPSMLVIRSVLGTKKTVVFVLLVIVMATISGMIFGSVR